MFGYDIIEWCLFYFRSLRDFADLFKGVITALFIWSLITMCGALLMIQIQLVSYSYNFYFFILNPFRPFHSPPFPTKFDSIFLKKKNQLHHNGDLVVLVMTVIEVIYAFSTMFISCELGQRLNFGNDECNEIIDQFKWYRFPANIQQMLPIIMNYAQQSVEVKCFGSAACNRETFKYVSSSPNKLISFD